MINFDLLFFWWLAKINILVFKLNLKIVLKNLYLKNNINKFNASDLSLWLNFLSYSNF